MDEIPLLLDQLKDPSWRVRLRACEQLKAMPSLPEEAVPALNDVFYDANFRVASEAMLAMKTHYKIDSPLNPEIYNVQKKVAKEDLSKKERLANMDILRMNKHLRSWAIVNFYIGIVSLFSFLNSDPMWGLMMIAVALLVWKIRIPAMFVLLSVAMGGAAIMNGLSVLSGGEVWWLVLAALQVGWTVSLVLEFRKYRSLRLTELYEADNWPEDYSPPKDEAVITSRFAVVSAVLAGIVMFFSPLLCAGIMTNSVASQTTYPTNLIEIAVAGSLDVAVLALGLGCAALLTKNHLKGFAIGGVVMSALVLAGWLIMIVLGSLAPQI